MNTVFLLAVTFEVLTGNGLVRVPATSDHATEAECVAAFARQTKEVRRLLRGPLTVKVAMFCEPRKTAN